MINDSIPNRPKRTLKTSISDAIESLDGDMFPRRKLAIADEIERFIRKINHDALTENQNNTLRKTIEMLRNHSHNPALKSELAQRLLPEILRQLSSESQTD